MKKHIIFAGLLLLLNGQVVAQDAITDSTYTEDSLAYEIEQTLVKTDKQYELSTLADDTAKISIREFKQEDIEAYRKKPEYDYEKEVAEDISFWDRLKMWLIRKLLFMKWGENDGNYIKYTFYTFAALVITWAIIKLIGMDIFNLFYFKKAKPTQTSGEWLENDIHQIDFEKEINEAITKNDYKIAVRLFYLFTLKKLTDKNLIQWEINKTNHDYSYELQKTVKGQQIKLDFEKATYYFEYVWYGDFKVNATQFDQAQELYKQFIKKI